MLQTERLELVPLNASQLKHLAENLPRLEAELNCSYQAEPMEGFFLDIVNGQLDITEKDPENFVWHSFWLIIRKSDRVVVGSADFKDIPNVAREVEIGYGLGSAFEHCGYMPLRYNYDKPENACKQSSKMHTFSPANAHFFTASF